MIAELKKTVYAVLLQWGWKRNQTIFLLGTVGMG